MDIFGNDVYNINQTLKEQNEIIMEMLGVMKKPENRLKNFLQILALIASIMGIISSVNIIVNWIVGG